MPGEKDYNYFTQAEYYRACSDGFLIGEWDMTSNPTDSKRKDSIYPFGIDDLELIDGVYQKPLCGE